MPLDNNAVRAAHLAAAQRPQVLHDLAPAGHGADRRPAAESLAQHAQVRRHAQVLLRTARGHAERGQHFVEEEDHAVPVAQLPAALQEAGPGQNAALVVVDRFEQQRGRLPAVGGKGLLQRRFVVERDDDDVAVGTGRDSRRFRIGAGRWAGPA